MLTSIPVEQPQPNQEFYGLDVLGLIQTHTRAECQAAGNPDLAFDPSRPEQDWWDDTYASHPPTETVTFSAVIYADDGTATIQTFTQSAKNMATRNFKGAPNYPKYTVQRTSAYHPDQMV